MNRSLSLGILLLLFLPPSPLRAEEKPASKLRAEIEAVINGPNYKQAHWGLLFVDMESGKLVYEHNADKLFAPASTTKLYSVAAALATLGADHRFQTPVHRRGEVDASGRLRGDLVLVASGDLNMGGRAEREGEVAFKNSDHTYANGNEVGELTEGDPLAGLNELARQTAAAGIRRLDGDMLIDDRLFDKAESTGSGPRRLTPIMINDNLIDLVITPTTAGSAATVTWRPQTAAFQVDARIDTVAKDQPLRIDMTVPRPGRLVVRGQIPAGHKPLVRVHEVEDAASFARALFLEALARAGVAVSASPLDANRPEQLPDRDAIARLPRVAALTSAPFSQSARLILKVSHNLHASTLPLLVAVRNGKRTLAEGLRLQHDFLARAGVDVDTISFGGGAGGARGDFTTPRATVQLLRHMATRSDFNAFQVALPVLGHDGTLADVVIADSPVRGKVRAKTGTFSSPNLMNDRVLLNSKALAGYLTTARGRTLAFALFVNNTHIDKTSGAAREGKVLGKLCEIVHAGE